MMIKHDYYKNVVRMDLNEEKKEFNSISQLYKKISFLMPQFDFKSKNLLKCLSIA